MGDFLKDFLCGDMLKCENSLWANTNQPPNNVLDISIAILYVDSRGFSMYGKCILHLHMNVQ